MLPAAQKTAKSTRFRVFLGSRHKCLDESLVGGVYLESVKAFGFSCPAKGRLLWRPRPRLDVLTVWLAGQVI